MSFRSLLSIALLVAAVFFERAAIYAQHVVLPLYLGRSATSYERVGVLLAIASWTASLAGPLGGALAIAVGPRWTATISAAVAAIGATILSLAPSTPIGLVLTSAGAGAFAPCAYAAVAETIEREDGASPRRFALAAAAVGALFLAADAAGLGAPMAAGMAATRSGEKTPLIAGVVSLVVAAIASAASAFVAAPALEISSAHPPAAPYRAPAPAPVASAPPRRSGAALAVLVVAYGVYCAASTFAFPRRLESLSIARMSTLWSIAPMIAFATCGLAFVIWCVAAATRQAWVPLATAPVGLVLVALGVAAMAETDSSTITAFGSVLAGAGEGIAGPVLAAYAALAVSGRMRALAVSGYLFAGATSASIAGAFREGSFHGAIGVAIAVVTLAAGALGIARARRFHALFTPS